MGSPALDTTVFSRVLYRLSYLAEATQCSPAVRVSLRADRRGHPPRAPALLDERAEVGNELFALV